MKKLLIAFMSIILMLSLFSCKGDDKGNDTQNSNKENATTQSSTKYPWGDKELELPKDEFE